MNKIALVGAPTAQPTGGGFDLASFMGLLKDIWFVLGLILVVSLFVWRAIRTGKARRIKALMEGEFSEKEIGEFVPPLMFLHIKKSDGQIQERLSYKKVVDYIEQRRFPRKGPKFTSPLFFVFANPACGKTKFAMRLYTEIKTRKLQQAERTRFQNKKTGAGQEDVPPTQVYFRECRKFNETADSFEALKSEIAQNRNAYLVFDGFDELLPGASGVGDAAAWREEKLYEIIDMLHARDNGNTIIITYRTIDRPNLMSGISAKTLGYRKISRLEICQYNRDEVSEKVAMRYAKRVFAVNNRDGEYNIDETITPDSLTYWEKQRIKKAIMTLYKAKDDKGKRIGKFIALPLYSAYAFILKDYPDLGKLSETTYFKIMVDKLLDREYMKKHPNENDEEVKTSFKEALTQRLIGLAMHFQSNGIFEIDSNDPIITGSGVDLPTSFLLCEDNNTKCKFQHEEFITYFSGLKMEGEHNRKADKLFTIFEEDSQLARGNHLIFSSNPSIKWRILGYKNRENKVLLISEQIIKLSVFNTTEHEGKPLNDWDSSDIKAYLNGDFISEAFSAEECTGIDGEEGGKVFLLSLDEASAYFSSNADRIACHEDETWWWWLKSPGDYDDIAAYVDNDGARLMFGDRVINVRGGVRPALWLKL